MYSGKNHKNLNFLESVKYDLHIAEISKFLKGISNPKMTEEEIKLGYLLKVNGFKRQFADKQISELEKIVNNDKLLPEEIKAAKELIEEKKKTEYNRESGSAAD